MAAAAPPFALLDALLHAVLLVEARSLRIVAANARAGRLLGCDPARLAGEPIERFAPTPEDAAFWAEAAAGGDAPIESESFLTTLDGGVVPVLRRAERLPQGEPGGFDGHWVVSLHDRGFEVDTARRLELALAELRAVLESTNDGILVTDLAGRIRHCNARFAQLWDIPDELLLQRDDDHVFDWMRGRTVDPVAYMRRSAEADDASRWPVLDRIELHSGRTVERVVRPLESHGRRLGRVASFCDLSEGLAARARIEQLAASDGLTGLPNRQRMGEVVAEHIVHARRHGAPFALLAVDLDRFQHINDTLGEAAGDRVLAESARRIQRVLRQDDRVARLHADAYVVLLPGADAASAQAIARRIGETLAQPHRHEDLNFTVTASIGIARYPLDGTTTDTLLASADAAMREAKAGGRAGIRMCDERRASIDAPDPRAAIALDPATRQALTQGRFRLHYQPQVSLADGSISGVEALIRWRDPTRGEIPPGDFIPVAEASGFIVQIGDWVLRQAVQQAAAWRRQGRALRVSVNVSALQFGQSGFVDGVAAALREARLPGAWLELELTESILLRDAADAQQRLAALHALGVLLTIDDFGTGFSSLDYLMRLPIARLKIDRSFVSGLLGDASDAGIVRAVIQMSTALALPVLAEGVETEAQRDCLRALGCDAFQGFLVAPALSPKALEELLDCRAEAISA